MWRTSRTLARLPVAVLVLASGAASVRAQPDIVIANNETARACLRDAGGNYSCSDVTVGGTLDAAVADLDGQNGPDLR